MFRLKESTVRIAYSPVSASHAVHNRHHRYTAVGAVDAAPMDGAPVDHHSS
jgi:hypothetical protein